MEYYQGNISVSLRVKAIIKGDMIFFWRKIDLHLIATTATKINSKSENPKKEEKEGIGETET